MNARNARASLAERLASGPPLLLDGAGGTELERLGIATDLPLWSARGLIDAPAVLEEIHAAYASAGAEILTANTFRTQRRTLDHAGIGERAAELCARAVELARSAADAAGSNRVWIAGSAPPLEDCYRADRTPDELVARIEHAEHARNLAEAGVDLILVETQNSVREAACAARAASATGLPFFVGFVAWNGAQLLSGEPLDAGIAAVAPFAPLAVLVNCLPPSNVNPCLQVLRESALPFGVYANLGAPTDDSGAHPAGSRSEECSPDEFATRVCDWISMGASIVGGCCGTTPAHIRAIHDLPEMQRST